MCRDRVEVPEEKPAFVRGKPRYWPSIESMARHPAGFAFRIMRAPAAKHRVTRINRETGEIDVELIP